MVPCAALALLVHPSTSHNILNRFSWAFCVYLEAVSVLPQLRLMQNTKVNSSSMQFPWVQGEVTWSKFCIFCRLWNHSLLTMCLLWGLRGFLAVPTGFFRFVFRTNPWAYFSSMSSRLSFFSSPRVILLKQKKKYIQTKNYLQPNRLTAGSLSRTTS